jgi:hypothetical protein
MFEEWNVGVMEYWNNGMVEEWKIGIETHYSNVPVFHHSIRRGRELK